MPRLVVPIILLAICIAALVAANRLGTDNTNEPLFQTVASTDTPVLSARRLPEQLTVPIANEALTVELEAVMDRSPSGTCLMVTEGDEVLFSEGEELSLTPASTMKILTGFAAIEQLGADYRFTTKLLAEAEPVDGVLSGDLYLVGGGDPLLMTADYVRSFENPPVRTEIEELADAVVAAGITQITGAVVGVETRYDDERYPEDWPDRYATQGQSGPLSALMINDAFTSFPETARAREEGEVPSASGDPAKHAAAFFDDLLEARNLVINAGAKNVSGRDISELVSIGAIESLPLRDIVKQMMVHSDNTTAELLAKEIGLSFSDDPSTEGGANAIQDILSKQDLPEIAVPRDGSGLDAANKLTCPFLVQLLQLAGPDTDLGVSLPVAGQDGTLRDRFTGSSAEGRLHAKTGSLNDVTALAGFVEADDGHILEFAYIANVPGDSSITDAIRAAQRPLGEALAEYPIGPPVEAVAPPDSAATADEDVVIGGEPSGAEADVDVEENEGVDRGTRGVDDSESDEADAEGDS